ncbi:MAG: hypothetical protein ACLTYN_17460 [Dysosmobacter welbionis]
MSRCWATVLWAPGSALLKDYSDDQAIVVPTATDEEIYNVMSLAYSNVSDHATPSATVPTTGC